MSGRIERNRRLIVSALIPAAILIGLVLATGAGNLFGSSSTPSPPSSGAAPPPPPSNGQVQGVVNVQARHLQGHQWQFTYTVHNVGKVPIAGFQLNSSRANLFNIFGRKTWIPFGTGVCGGNYQNVLVYWSTGSTAPATLPPTAVAQFGFKTNTTGVTSMSYSLSFGSARAQFGVTRGPAPSRLPASGPCR